MGRGSLTCKFISCLIPTPLLECPTPTDRFLEGQVRLYPCHSSGRLPPFLDFLPQISDGTQGRSPTLQAGNAVNDIATVSPDEATATCENQGFDHCPQLRTLGGLSHPAERATKAGPEFRAMHSPPCTRYARGVWV